jgi:antirestriction protein ArdC
MVPVPFAPRGRNRAARKQRGTAMTKERFDIHQHITDKIVSAIERGAGDFRLPWHRTKGNIMRPVNIASKKAYRGVNVVALWAYAEEFGYSTGTWGTYKQWSEAGAQVVPVIDPLPATVITPIEQAEAFVVATGASITHGGTLPAVLQHDSKLRRALCK